MNSPLLIGGLGNPGLKYDNTRHNIGFSILDSFAQCTEFKKHLTQDWTEKTGHKGHILTSKLKANNQTIILIKPQTYMNLSGESIQSVVRFFKIPLEQTLIIHDDVDMDFGAMKYQTSRGHGGHNGIRNIHSHLSSSNYARLKLGVNSPRNSQTETFVLDTFTKEEQTYIENTWKPEIHTSLMTWTLQGTLKASSLHNKKEGVKL